MADRIFSQPTDDELDHAKMGRGKHADRTADEVAQLDPSYLCWAYENWDRKPCSRLLYDAAKADLQAARTGRRVDDEQGHD